MSIYRNTILAVVAVLIMVLPVTVFTNSIVPTVVAESPNRTPISPPISMKTTQVMSLLNQRQTSFIQNRGQWDSRVRYKATFGHMTAYLDDRGWTIRINKRVYENPDRHSGSSTNIKMPRIKEIHGAVIRMRLAGGRDRPKLVAENEHSGYYNFISGSDSSLWRNRVPGYSSVRYESVYAGVNLRLREMEGHLEYDVLVDKGQIS